jgi:hypothetical protein
MLTDDEKQTILLGFPNIKLSYENIVHKKVYNANINVAIPKGAKNFAWFTSFNGNNICFIMELTNNNQIKDIKITNACFSSQLSYGTILYGTIINQYNNNFFSVEDIYYYKGKKVNMDTWGNKLVLMKELLSQNLKQIAYNKSFIVFGLPLFSNNIDDFQNKISNIKYEIDSIQFRSFNRVNNYLFMYYDKFIQDKIVENRKVEEKKPENRITIINGQKRENTNENDRQMNKNTKNNLKREVIFLIKPDIQNDIYNLYCNNNNTHKTIFYDVAYIPDFCSSVMMNKLFRNIKENQNLDALEESDDEEEFENEREDRFVDLNKEYKMVCAYSNKFKKWYPLKLADNKFNIIYQKELPNIEKK